MSGKRIAVLVSGGGTNLQALIDAAEAGETVLLVRNVKNASTLIVPDGKKVTINLQGYYYAVTQVQLGAALVIEEGAEVVSQVPLA